MKTIWKTLFVLLISLLFTAACGGQTEDGTDGEDNTNITTTIVGGRVGGAWSVFTEGIAESIRREVEDSYITVEPGSIIENPIMVASGKVPYGISYSMTAFAAFIGNEPYHKAFEDIRALCVVIPANYYQFLVTADSPVESIDELIENKIGIRLAVDQQGSIGELITREIFASNGVTFDDLENWGGSVNYLSGSKTFEMMSDGRIDATGDAESAPSSNILEASTTLDLKLLSLDQKTIEALEYELGVKANKIPAGTYEFQQEDIDTVSTPAILIVHKDVPDEEVYTVAKSIYNNLEYLHTVHEEFKNLSPENMVNVGEIPLHPGAKQFFKEVGLLD